jgi:hypothetical protein
MAGLVTTKGKEIVWNRLKGTGTEPLYVGWGTSTASQPFVAVGDTNLGTAAPEARVAGTSSLVTTTATNDTYQVVAQVTASATRAITEVGLFDSAGAGSPPSGGNLFVHADYTAINLSSGDSITFTIKTQLT